ncbi:MAG: hypothetical protein A2Y57_04455 [Candidatus Woykebacteria bacterium RBG_13_40_7b]|uniref:Uncharacterized protein n=1 Tax=Candidatus Woykebacteria bacterium RBG_13_40_7b TaxID=1802594 RepID=A0A1G1W857_9BACT|nr:MAG: hypothetical protein A2Y57_04455 [Candidatus Woykebacteria bacterium RBG_13_40_7b]
MPAPIVNRVQIGNWLRSKNPLKKGNVIYLSRHDAIHNRNPLTIVVIGTNAIKIESRQHGQMVLFEKRTVFIVKAREIAEGEGLDRGRVQQALTYYAESVEMSERSGRYRRGLPPDQRGRILD